MNYLDVKWKTIVYLTLILLITGCNEVRSVNNSPSEESLVEGAMKTQAKLLQSNTPNDDNIPSKYWDESIKTLKPISVRSFCSNYFVVQKNQSGVESGVFIGTPISSCDFPTKENGYDFIPFSSKPSSFGIVQYYKHKIQ